MKEFPLQGGVLVVAEIQILRHQRRPSFSLQSQGEHSKGAGHCAGFIREVLVPLKLPHSQTSVSLHSRMQTGVLHSAGKELIDSLLGQAGNGQIEFFLPTELHRVTAGKFLLRKHRTQVVQDFRIAPLGAVPRGDTDGGESVVGRGGQVLCFPLLDIRWQFAAAIGFQFLYHVRTNLGNQAEDVFGFERLKALSIHRATDSHIAGKAQQSFVHILRPQFRPHRAGRKDCKPIVPLSHKEVPLLHLLFYVLLQCIADLIPACQPPQGIAECNSFLIGESLQRQFGQIPLQQLIRKERCSVVISHHSRVGGVIFTGGAVQHILNAEIRLRQYLR